MTILLRSALSALALLASITVAAAQTAPSPATGPGNGQGAGANQPGGMMGGQGPQGMMGGQGPQGMMGGQGPQGMMGGQQMAQGCPQMMGNTSSPMAPAIRQMHQAMSGTQLTGDSDRDFAAAMVAHHQGALDMAQAELKNGKDPAMRQLAERIVKSQEGEVKEMNDWLAKYGSK